MDKPIKAIRLWEKEEPFLHSHFHRVMSPDFFTAYEVSGTCLVNHPAVSESRVRADYLCYPRPHVIDAGFVDSWFAVEIKACKGHHLEKGLRQAFWYTLSRFQIKDRVIVPAFSCLWMPQVPDDIRFAEYSGPNKGKVSESANYRESGIKHVMAYMNVATMTIGGKKQPEWRIDLHGRYASRSYERNFDGSVRGLTVSRNIQGFKVRIGNKAGVASHSGMMGGAA